MYSLEVCRRDVIFFCLVQGSTKDAETVSESVPLPVAAPVGEDVFLMHTKHIFHMAARIRGFI